MYAQIFLPLTLVPVLTSHLQSHKHNRRLFSASEARSSGSSRRSESGWRALMVLPENTRSRPPLWRSFRQCQHYPVTSAQVCSLCVVRTQRGIPQSLPDWTSNKLNPVWPTALEITVFGVSPSSSVILFPWWQTRAWSDRLLERKSAVMWSDL